MRRFYSSNAALPEDSLIEDLLLAENAFVRIVVQGEWEIEGARGLWQPVGKALLFGANSKPLKVRVKGPFRVFSFAIRPSAWRALCRQRAHEFVDQVVPLQTVWGELGDELARKIKATTSDKAAVAAMEAAVSAQLKRVRRSKVDEKIAIFEGIARTDSNAKMEDAALQVGLSVRQLERRCLFTFGINPKRILQRSRFLDMVEGMRGLVPEDEAAAAGARFFDQSHLNREFRSFSNMTPGKFAKAITPLFDAGLELRVAGKGII